MSDDRQERTSTGQASEGSAAMHGDRSLPQELPFHPVRAWHEERTVWPFLALILAFFPLISAGTERVGALDISSQGLTITGATFSQDKGRHRYAVGPRFVAWDSISRVDAPANSALATLTLVDGSTVELGSEHLPRDGGESARHERVALLQHGLALSRAQR